MLTIKNKALSYSNEQICSSDTILYLKSDVECKYLGCLSLTNGDIKMIDFIKVDEEYQGRLVITTEDINYVKGSVFKIIMISGPLTEDSNHIKLDFNVSAIKNNIKISTSNEIEELRKKLASVESIVSSLKSSKLLDALNISNLSYIKPGMIPVAVDDKGNFVAEYPFSQHVVEVNGQTAANGVVTIDSSMIEYSKEKSVEQIIKDLSTAVIKLNELLTTVINNQKEIRSSLDETKIRLETHITNGII